MPSHRGTHERVHPRRTSARLPAAVPSIAWPTPRSIAPPVPLPRTAPAVSRATCAPPESDPTPADSPTPPAPRSAIVRSISTVLRPSSPAATRCCLDRSSRAATHTSPSCAAVVPSPAKPALPVTSLLAEYPGRMQIRSMRRPLSPGPCLPDPVFAWPRNPSERGCRWCYARSWWRQPARSDLLAFF